MSAKDKYRKDGSLRPVETRLKIQSMCNSLERMDPDLSRLDTDALMVAGQLLHNIQMRQHRRTHMNTGSEGEHT